MEPYSSVESLQARRIKKRLQRLTQLVDSLPADRATALEEDILMSNTGAERQRRYADNLYRQGCKKVTVFLTPDALSALAELRDRTGNTQSEIVADALIRAALVDSAKDHGHETGQ